jgi:hypothetical protein
MYISWGYQFISNTEAYKCIFTYSLHWLLTADPMSILTVFRTSSGMFTENAILEFQISRLNMPLLACNIICLNFNKISDMLCQQKRHNHNCRCESHATSCKSKGERGGSKMGATTRTHIQHSVSFRGSITKLNSLLHATYPFVIRVQSVL